MAERVVVTGVGVVTPVGTDLAAFAGAVRAGRSGASRITAFDCEGFETRIAAEVGPEFDPVAYAHPAKSAKLMSRALRSGSSNCSSTIADSVRAAAR